MYILCAMDLATYMSANNLDDADMAAKIGRSRVAVSRYRRKLEIPSSETIRKIIEVSGGEVTANELLQIEPAGAAAQ